MHIIPEWDGNLGAAKSCMFQSLGSEDFIPGCSNEISSVVYGNAFFDSTDGGAPRILPTCYKEKSTVSIRLERANAGAPRVGPTTHWSKFSNPTTESRPSSTFEFRSVAIARHKSFGHLSFLPGATSPFLRCDSKYCCVWMLIPGPPRWPGQDQNTLMVGIYTIE